MQTIDPDLLRLRPGQRLLDLGCGEGRHGLALALSFPLEIHALDRAVRDLGIARQRWQELAPGGGAGTISFTVGDAYRLPFADGYFDVVVCSEVLEHLADYPAALAEIARVLRPGGLLAVSVPRRWPEAVCWLRREYHRAPGGHVRIFRTARLRGEIEGLGFRCYHMHGAHALHVPYWWLQCLFWHTRQQNLLVRLYHRMLVWDLLQRPWITTALDRLFNPVMGKSVALYFADGRHR